MLRAQVKELQAELETVDKTCGETGNMKLPARLGQQVDGYFLMLKELFKNEHVWYII